MEPWLIAVLAVLAVTVLWYIAVMNRFARLRVKIRESDSGIDVALTKRFDTLTKLLDVTRGYAKHEAETLGKVVELRQGMSMAEKAAASTQMDALTGRINVLAEAYPELRSSENFRQLQLAISEVEEHLQAARRIYNMNVSAFNQMLVTWPDSIIGRIHGYVQEACFEAEEYKRQDVSMNFGQ